MENNQHNTTTSPQTQKIPKKWVILRGLVRGQFHWAGFDTELKNTLSLDTVITPDLPGNGYKYNELSPIDLDIAVESIRSQCDLKKDEPIGLLGISLGGMIAAEWAYRYPHEMSHLVIINTSSKMNPFYDRLKPKNYLGLLNVIFNRSPANIERYVLNSVSNRTDSLEKHLASFTSLREKYPTQLKNLFRQISLALKAEFNKPNVKHILLLVSIKDRFVSHKCTEKIGQKWSKPVIYNQTAGHDMTLDDPSWVIEQIKKYFN